MNERKDKIKEEATKKVDVLINNGYIDPSLRDIKIKQLVEKLISINSKDKE